MLCTLRRFQLYGTCTRQCIVTSRVCSQGPGFGCTRHDSRHSTAPSLFRWPPPGWARVATALRIPYRRSREVAQDKGRTRSGRAGTVGSAAFRSGSFRLAVVAPMSPRPGSMHAGVLTRDSRPVRYTLCCDDGPDSSRFQRGATYACTALGK